MGSAPRVIGDLDEAAVVDLLRGAFARTGDAGVPLGIGDDAAVVSQPSGSVVATTDTMVKDLDWRDDWSSAHDVGTKIVTQNVADVAAMGARPTGLLLTLVLDPATPLAWVQDLADGVADACVHYGVPVVGGDLSGAPAGVVTLSITALGDLEGRSPVRRDGARDGDVVAVSGHLGWSGAGLELFLNGDVERTAAKDAVRAYHRAPVVDAQAGVAAALAGATSMIDISDGLSRDGGRIASAGGVVLDLDDGALQAMGELSCEALGPRGLDAVLHGGEEHTLLATFPAAEGAPSGWLVIGRVHRPDRWEEPGQVYVGGALLRTRAWDHFAG